MATLRFRGDAAAVAQVDTFTPATVTIGNIFTLTINGKTVNFTATAATAANVTAGIVALLQASTIPEFREITWADKVGALTGTANTAGMPFTATSSATQGTGSAGMTFTRAATTASAGPNDLSLAANYSAGSLPANGDDLHFDTSVDVLYNLTALSGITLNSLNIPASFTNAIGLPQQNANGYFEYRSRYLQVGLQGAFAVNVGYGQGTGSGLIRLDTLTTQTTLIVNATAQSSEAGTYALCWKGTHASNVVEVNRGSVGIARTPGELATVATLNVNYVSNVAGDSTVYCGPGTTLTTINKGGGSLILNSAVTTLTQANGGVTTIAVGAVTALTINAGTVCDLAAGTIVTTLTVGAGATFDVSQDQRAKTITNCTLYKGATLNDPNGSVAYTNGIQPSQCALTDLTLNVGVNRKITPA